MTPIRSLLILNAFFWCGAANAGDSAAPPPTNQGHSHLGEAFNEGPRQAAKLLFGQGAIRFPAATKNQAAQAFIVQGVGQLHGFWYWEAERSFRQAAALDPACGIAYWGMAMANVQNEQRARGFIAQAVAKKGAASKREASYISAYDAFFKEKQRDADRYKRLIRDLEDVVHQFPDDLEAKAFLALAIWNGGSNGLAIGSTEAADALVQQILHKAPLHPVNHYLIHLWDGDGRGERALPSAARCGQSAPGIAHMWHMSAHIFSKLHRYHDSAWQLEASARVDHANMERDFVVPYEIHNYAHNNTWLVKDLSYGGRARQAVLVARNLIDEPRHPKHNAGTDRGDAASMGQAALLRTLTQFELWDDLIAEASNGRLAASRTDAERIARWRALGSAYVAKGDRTKAREPLKALEQRLALHFAAEKATAAKPAKPPAAGNEAKSKATTDSPKVRKKAVAESTSDKFSKEDLAEIESAIAELRVFQLLAEQKTAEAKALLTKADKASKSTQISLHLQVGDKEKAEKLARAAVADQPQQALPLAQCIEVLTAVGKPEQAKPLFEQLRTLAGTADLDSPPFQRLAPIAKGFGWPADWRTPAAASADSGVRPPLEALGPLTWRPWPAPTWSRKDSSGIPLSLERFRSQNKPVVLIFYLGAGCIHCVEQLRAFEPLAGRFRNEGIELVGISSETPAQLAESLKVLGQGKAFPFPLAADSTLELFKAYRAYDDFERMPLHATFLVDPQGMIRWREIRFEPFKDAEFLLGEAKRLLHLPTAPLRPVAAAEQRPR